MTKHLYLGIENLNLTAPQRQQLFDALISLGPPPPGYDQPAYLLHWRLPLENEAGIFEGMFAEDTLTVEKLKGWLANIFSVSPVTIGTTVENRDWGGQTTPVVTFFRSGIDYVRMALFAGTDASWSESGDAARGYLSSANREAWEPEGAS